MVEQNVSYIEGEGGRGRGKGREGRGEYVYKENDKTRKLMIGLTHKILLKLNLNWYILLP